MRLSCRLALANWLFSFHHHLDILKTFGNIAK